MLCAPLSILLTRDRRSLLGVSPAAPTVADENEAHLGHLGRDRGQRVEEDVEPLHAHQAPEPDDDEGRRREAEDRACLAAAGRRSAERRRGENLLARGEDIGRAP